MPTHERPPHPPRHPLRCGPQAALLAAALVEACPHLSKDAATIVESWPRNY